MDIQKPDKANKEANNNRKHICTMYFPEGTPASEVCRYVNVKQNSKSGIWLLQLKVSNPDFYADVEDGCYVLIKDSKHRLEADKQYAVMFYNGPEIFLK